MVVVAVQWLGMPAVHVNGIAKRHIMNNDRKRRKVEVRKQKAKVKDKNQLARATYRQNYPSFDFENPEIVDPNFVELIRQGIKAVNFDDRNLFSKNEAELWKLCKKNGGLVLYEELTDFICKKKKELPDGANEAEDNLLIELFFRKLPCIIYSSLPEDKMREFAPYYDMIIFPDKNIRVRFRSIKSKKGTHGTIYHSKHLPKIEVDGQNKIVGFSKHAIKQICERLTYEAGVDVYSWAHDVFSFFEQCTYFEPVTLPNGQLGFTFYAECGKGCFNWRYVEEVWAGDIEDDYNYYFRMGYCPAEVDGDFVVAKTLLYPGYSNTPERQLIHNHHFPTREEKYKMIELARSSNRETLKQTDDFTLFHFFHLHGVPQVKATEEVYYEKAFAYHRPSVQARRIKQMVMRKIMEKKK